MTMRMIVLAPLLVGACTNPFSNCPDRTEYSGMDDLPSGCRVSSGADTGLATVVCADGRSGFAVVDLIGGALR